MLSIGSLFSGIGGLELGLEWAGLGPTVWQVERDPFCRSVLARHWPEVRRYDEIEAVRPDELGQVDLICGGFPCQDLSSAGARAGLAGRRSGLWGQFARIVSGVRPCWVCVENVASGASAWVDAVVRELEQLHYEALPIPVRADWLGAPAPRARVFVVARLADADRQVRQPVQPEHGQVGGPSPAAPVAARPGPVPGWRKPMPDVARVVPGDPKRVDAQRALGNCVIPQCAEVIGHVIRELAGL